MVRSERGGEGCVLCVVVWGMGGGLLHIPFCTVYGDNSAQYKCLVLSRGVRV